VPKEYEYENGDRNGEQGSDNNEPEEPEKDAGDDGVLHREED